MNQFGVKYNIWIEIPWRRIDAKLDFMYKFRILASSLYPPEWYKTEENISTRVEETTHASLKSHKTISATFIAFLSLKTLNEDNSV